MAFLTSAQLPSWLGRPDLKKSKFERRPNQRDLARVSLAAASDFTSFLCNEQDLSKAQASIQNAFGNPEPNRQKEKIVSKDHSCQLRNLGLARPPRSVDI